MSLYKLPKDLLVKLISTIRKDTVEEYQEKINEKDKQINNLKYVLAEIKQIYRIEIYKCSYCDKYEVGDDLEYITFCYQCQEECCPNHYNAVEGGLLCIKCQKLT